MVPQYINDGTNTNKYQVANIYCYSGLAAGNGSCYIMGVNGPGSAYGTLVSFSTNRTDCPLDNYVPFSVFAIGVVGFLCISRRDF